MATRTKQQQTEIETVETNSDQEETAVQTTVTTEPTGVQAMRASLRAAGLKRCPTHDHYMNRLPDEFRKPVEGQTDPAIRPLDEFNGHISACKQCSKIRAQDKRNINREASGRPTNSVVRLVALMRKEDELAAKAKAVRATLTEDELDRAEALYHEVTSAV